MDQLQRNRLSVVALVVTLVALGCGLPATPVSPTREITPVIIATAEPTPSPQPSVPPTLPPTATPPPTLTPTPIPTQPPPTLPPPTSTPPPTPGCAVLPEGVFLAIWQSDAARQAVLGCPISNHPRIEPAAWEVQTAYQPFEHGAMIWSDHIGWYEKPIIYVLYDDGTFEGVDDTFDPNTDPTSGGETPPASLFEPILGFGKVWHERPDVRAALGWATAEETPGAGRFQLFTGGNMIWLSQRGETVVLLFDSSTYAIESSPTFE
jgi:hypothetical protein